MYIYKCALLCNKESNKEDMFIHTKRGHLFTFIEKDVPCAS